MAQIRAADHSAPLEIGLVRTNIPFVKCGGLKFLDSAHVKDVLALLRLLQNPRDRVAGFRLFQLQPGIGPGSTHKLLDAMNVHDYPLAALATLPGPTRGGSDWDALVTLLCQMQHAVF